jgi:hypothetical protein
MLSSVAAALDPVDESEAPEKPRLGEFPRE